MKKILTAIALIMCLALPLSAMAMTTIADNDLSTVTGQAGVSIDMNVSLSNISFDQLAWGDLDGIQSPLSATLVGFTSAGWIGLGPTTISNLQVQARTDPYLVPGAAAYLATGMASTVAGAWSGAGASATLVNLATVNTAAASLLWASGSTLSGAYHVTPTTAGTLYTLGLKMQQGYTSAQLGIDPTTAGNASSFYGSATALGITSPTTGATSVGAAIGLALKYAAQDSAVAATQTSTMNAANKVLANQFLTIDVGSNSKGQTMVQIGLPTVDLTIDSLNTTVYLWDGAVGSYGYKPGSNAQKLGDIYIGNLELLLGRNGYIDIYATNYGASNASGVTINLGAKVDFLTMKALSWGDNDGVGLSTVGGLNYGAGFVGLTDVVIKDLAFVGFAIDVNVATVFNNGTTGPTEPDTPILGDSKSATYKNFIFTIKNAQGQIGTTWVDIGLAGKLTMGEFYAQAALGIDKTLGRGGDGSSYLGYPSQILGNLYMSNLSATITSGSWVTISAH